MRPLSRLLRVNCFSSSLRTCRPVFSTPPCPVHPTKSFATTPALHKFQVPKRKKEPANMGGGDMTTFKGKPFDRPSLESLMKVRNNNL
jgi:glycyl-tRNA synthetase